MGGKGANDAVEHEKGQCKINASLAKRSEEPTDLPVLFKSPLDLLSILDIGPVRVFSSS